MKKINNYSKRNYEITTKRLEKVFKHIKMLNKMIKTSFMMFIFINIILCASSEDEIRKRLQALYGENKEISGNYDTTLSVTCNNGIFVGKKKENIISYKGIPYAKPPIGNFKLERSCGCR